MATTQSQLALAAYGALLIAAIASADLPLLGLLGRASLFLPFALTFSAATWWIDGMDRALLLLERAYLSGLAAVVFSATTPMHSWAAALHAWRVPRLLVLTTQFVYRYLFVLAEQAQSMRQAARLRGGSAHAVGVLFARSWERANATGRAMTARGFSGEFPLSLLPRFRRADAAFAVIGIVLAAGIRIVT